jgi:hypothetical protein
MNVEEMERDGREGGIRKQKSSWSCLKSGHNIYLTMTGTRIKLKSTEL